MINNIATYISIYNGEIIDNFIENKIYYLHVRNKFMINKNIFYSQMIAILFGMDAGTTKEMNEYGLNLHNTYLQAFLEIGLIGLLTILGFFLIIFFNINILFLPFLSVIFLLGNILEVFYFPLLLFIFYLSKLYEGKK